MCTRVPKFRYQSQEAKGEGALDRETQARVDVRLEKDLTEQGRETPPALLDTVENETVKKKTE